MSTLTICNGPDCPATAEGKPPDGWLTLMRWGAEPVPVDPSLDFHAWGCLRAYAEREVTRDDS